MSWSACSAVNGDGALVCVYGGVGADHGQCCGRRVCAGKHALRCTTGNPDNNRSSGCEHVLGDSLRCSTSRLESVIEWSLIGDSLGVKEHEKSLLESFYFIFCCRHSLSTQTFDAMFCCHSLITQTFDAMLLPLS